MIEKLFQSQSFCSGLLTIVDMLFMLILVYLICRSSGLADGKTGARRVTAGITNVRKLTSSFICNGGTALVPKRKARFALFDMRIRIHNMGSVMRVFQFEGYGYPPILKCIQKFGEAEGLLDEVAVFYNNSKLDELASVLGKLDSLMADCEELVKEAEAVALESLKKKI